MIFACFAKNTFYSKSTKNVPTAHIAYIHQLKIQDNCYYVKGYGAGKLWGKNIAHELRLWLMGCFFFIRAISFSLLSCNPNKLLGAAVTIL